MSLDLLNSQLKTTFPITLLVKAVQSITDHGINTFASAGSPPEPIANTFRSSEQKDDGTG